MIRGGWYFSDAAISAALTDKEWEQIKPHRRIRSIGRKFICHDAYSGEILLAPADDPDSPTVRMDGHLYTKAEVEAHINALSRETIRLRQEHGHRQDPDGDLMLLEGEMKKWLSAKGWLP